MVKPASNKPGKRLLFSADEIAREVRRLVWEIVNDYQDRDLVLVGVLKGVFVFLADLVRQFTIPVEVDFVRLASYGSSTTTTGSVLILTDVNLNLSNRDVLIIEDIVDSGLTLRFLREHLLAHNPRSLKICTLVDKTERRVTNIPVDYVGLKIDKGFVVGYGMDYNEAYRYLPDIYELLM